MKSAPLAFLLLVLSHAAFAAGVAIVEAPEQSIGVCAEQNVTEAFACARKQCVEGGAAEVDCFEIAYCDYGWTVDVLMKSEPEGSQWHEFHCGWSTRAEAEAAGRLACNPERMKELSACTTVQIYDPTAVPQLEK